METKWCPSRDDQWRNHACGRQYYNNANTRRLCCCCRASRPSRPSAWAKGSLSRDFVAALPLRGRLPTAPTHSLTHLRRWPIPLWRWALQFPLPILLGSTGRCTQEPSMDACKTSRCRRGRGTRSLSRRATLGSQARSILQTRIPWTRVDPSDVQTKYNVSCVTNLWCVLQKRSFGCVEVGCGVQEWGYVRLRCAGVGLRPAAVCRSGATSKCCHEDSAHVNTSLLVTNVGVWECCHLLHV